MRATVTLATLAVVVAACSGDAGDAESGASPDSDPLAGAVASGGLPSWIGLDTRSRTLSLEITAGQGPENERWNFNGHANGEVSVVVPSGFDVTIEFSNADPANRHSIAVLERADRFPLSFEDVAPAFDGAISTSATSVTGATGLDESETVTFSAEREGSFALVCLVPAHAATGMWIGFDVSDSARPGLDRDRRRGE